MKKLILKIFSVFFFLLPTSYLLTPTSFAAVTRPVFFAIEPQYQAARDFHEGLALVNIKGRWGYINKEGKVAIKASYYEAGFFNFGLAPVRTRRSYRGWGFISHKNKFAIPRWFNNLGNFGEGLAPAAADTRWGFINVRGDWEITPQFEDARSFSEGLAAVKVENSWGFIRQ